MFSAQIQKAHEFSRCEVRNQTAGHGAPIPRVLQSKDSPQTDTDMTGNSGNVSANIVDIDQRRIYAANVQWTDGVITAMQETGSEHLELPYLIPGFIDAHIHLESSLLPPAEFARLAVRHGTVATVSDPHEIANILGIEGVHWMLENVQQTPFHVLLGAPS